MPDTHDERGGDEAAMLIAIRRRALTASTYAEWHQVGRDIETLVEQLAAATARAEKAEALVAELGEPEVEQRMISPSGLVYEPTLRDLENQDYWLPGVRLEERQVYPTPWRVVAGAAQDGRSGPVERSEMSGGAFQANASATASAGLSGPGPCRSAVSIGAMPYACVLPEGHDGLHDRMMWHHPDWDAWAAQAARQAKATEGGQHG